MLGGRKLQEPAKFVSEPQRPRRTGETSAGVEVPYGRATGMPKLQVQTVPTAKTEAPVLPERTMIPEPKTIHPVFSEEARRRSADRLLLLLLLPEEDSWVRQKPPQASRSPASSRENGRQHLEEPERKSKTKSIDRLDCDNTMPTVPLPHKNPPDPQEGGFL